MKYVLTDTEWEERRKEAEYIATCWRINLERNRLSVPSNKPVDMNSESV